MKQDLFIPTLNGKLLNSPFLNIKNKIIYVDDIINLNLNLKDIEDIDNIILKIRGKETRKGNFKLVNRNNSVSKSRSDVIKIIKGVGKSDVYLSQINKSIDKKKDEISNKKIKFSEKESVNFRFNDKIEIKTLENLTKSLILEDSRDFLQISESLMKLFSNQRIFYSEDSKEFVFEDIDSNIKDCKCCGDSLYLKHLKKLNEINFFTIVIEHNINILREYFTI